MGYSIAERDAEQRTARDIAEKAGIKDNIEAIGWCNISLIHLISIISLLLYKLYK